MDGEHTESQERVKMDTAHRYIADMHHTLDRIPVQSVEQVIQALAEARLTRRRIFIFGNGGSASTASHFACDLTKNTRQPALPDFRVTSLNENIAILSAYGNDEGFENIFSSQLENEISPGDVVIGISTSGKSPNVLKTIQVANAAAALTIGFTGFDGGALGSLVDLHIHIPSDCIEQVEDIHLMLEHLICSALREAARDSQAVGPAPLSLNQKDGMEYSDLLRHMLLSSFMSLGAASGGMVILPKNGGQAEGITVYAGEARFMEPANCEEIMGEGLAGWVYTHHQPALVSSTRSDERWIMREWDEPNGIPRSAISIPLTQKDRTVGILTLSRKGANKFKEDDLALLFTPERWGFDVSWLRSMV